MTKVNYDEISRIYDDVREADVALVNCFVEEVAIQPETAILDIGCGTGNYASALQRITRALVHGIEPSEGMIQKAQEKNPDVVFRQGDAAHIPFEDDAFDFAYMTDVIHHVPDITAMFAELRRVLKPGGKVCIATQSHSQIERRPIVQFFPGTANVDKARYPDLPAIVETGKGRGFTFLKIEVLYENEAVTLDERFLELAQKKGYSMLHLISEEEYCAGLEKLQAALRKGPIPVKSSGESLVWLAKF